MRKLFLALVGCAGLYTAGQLLPVGYSEHIIDRAVTYTILGQVPGTNIQLGFVSATVLTGTIIVALLGLGILRHHQNTILDLLADRSDADTDEDPLSPFDNDELIMIASETDELIGRHQGLPVQLQLFEQV